jgi:hypothetical protein
VTATVKLFIFVKINAKCLLCASKVVTNAWRSLDMKVNTDVMMEIISVLLIAA